MTPLARCLLAAAVTLVPAGRAASAMELVVGGYGAHPGHASAFYRTDPDPALAFDGGGSVVLDFTPRGAGLFAPSRAGTAPRLQFELGLASSPEIPAAAMEAGESAGPSWLQDPAQGLGDLSIGGALHWSDWSLGGGFARTALLGGEADLMSATVGYGSLSASLAYGQAERADLPPLDVLMLSTDVAAWSWLTLESDVALGSNGETESVAVGRLGVRLNF